MVGIFRDGTFLAKRISASAFMFNDKFQYSYNRA